MNLFETMKADTYRKYGKFSLCLAIKGVITDRTFRVIMSLRLCQVVANSRSVIRIMLPVFQVFHGITTHWAALDLSWRTKVGAAIAINHGWGIVVSPGVCIGNNVTLFHGVTLGRRDRISPDGTRIIEYPVVEDEVWIGPHAIIVGGITIGRGSRIAGGSFVTENVPPYSIVSGNPAVVVKCNCVPDVMNPFESMDNYENEII